MQGLLSAQGAAAMNKLVYYVFLPALVLTSLGASATAERIGAWWFMLLNCWINVLAGLAIGALLASVLRLPADLRRPYIACCGIGAPTTLAKRASKRAHPLMCLVVCPHAADRAVRCCPRESLQRQIPRSLNTGMHTSAPQTPDMRAGSFGNIPLILVSAISRRSERFESADGALGVAYIFTSLISGSVAVFAVGNYLLRVRNDAPGEQDPPDAAATTTVEAAAPQHGSKSKSRHSAPHVSLAGATHSAAGTSESTDSGPSLVAYRPTHDGAPPPRTSAHAAAMLRQAEYTWRPSGPAERSVFSAPGAGPAGQFAAAPTWAADAHAPHAHSAPGEWGITPVVTWQSASQLSDGGSVHGRRSGHARRHTLQTLQESHTAELRALSGTAAGASRPHRRHSHTGASSIASDVMVAMDSMPVSDQFEGHQSTNAEGLRSGGAVASTTAGGGHAGLRRAGRLLWAACQGTFLNPPTVAVLVALAVALAEPVKEAFFGEEGAGPDAAPPPLDVITQVLRRFGAAMIPALMIALGGALARGPGAAVPARAIVSIIAVRLVALPVAGGAAVLGLRAWGVFEPPDDMFTLVALLQQAMPSALNVFTLAAVHGNQAAAVATLLFWQYLASVVTIPACVAAFLSLL